MKVALVFVSLLAVTWAVAAPRPVAIVGEVPLTKMDKQAVIELFEGIAIGLVGTIGDLSQCIPQAASAAADVKAFLAAFKDFEKNPSVEGMEALLHQLGHVAEDFKEAADVCGLETVAQEIKYIIEELKSPSGRFDLVTKLIIKILRNQQDIYADLKGAKELCDQEQWSPCGVDIGKVLGLLVKLDQVAAQETQQLFLMNTKEDVIQFLEGVAIGYIGTAANLSACIPDAMETVADVKAFWKEFQEFKDHPSIGEMEQMLVLLGHVGQDFKDAAEVCGVSLLVEDLVHAISELRSPSGRFKLAMEIVVKIIYHGSDIYADIKDCITQIEAKQWSPAGVDVGKILGIIAKKDKSA